jgi:ribosome-binding protein aMBF1 (putative translation factor)
MMGGIASRDDLDDFIAERTRAKADFPAMVEEALARRQLLRALAEERQAEGLTRTTVAARMGTSESAVARLEGGQSDTKLSTVARYAAALGKRIEWKVVDGRPAPAGRKR